MAGRKKDVIWSYFSEESTSSGKGVKAKCKQCGKQMMGLVARMKKHIEMCIPEKEKTVDEVQHTERETVSTSRQPETALVLKQPFQQLKRKDSSDGNGSSTIPHKRHVDQFLIKTTSLQKNAIDEQVAKFIYATNSSFRAVEHPEFKKMVSVLRPGYIPPNQTEIGGRLLDTVFEQENQKCERILNGQTVNMSFDGWSNVHNEPIVCVTVTTSAGNTYLVDTIDTSGNPHTAEYLTNEVKKVLLKCEAEYKCHVRSLVTDNASNVKNMRTKLEEDKDFDVITYGCSAHILNLLAADLNIANVMEHVIHVAKYFRNNHFASAKYKQEGGQKFILPQVVRWNTMADCLSHYLRNWPIIMKVCEKNRDNIESNVYNKVTNFNLKRSVEDLLKRLGPISEALDMVQKTNCTISTAVHIWKDLENRLKAENLDKATMKSFSTRYSQALGPPHFLAYLLDPRYARECCLNSEEKHAALLFAKQRYSTSVVPVLMKFLAKSSPFHDFLFDSSVVTNVSPLDWCKAYAVGDDAISNTDILKVVLQLLTANASSASVERIFSTFGLIHSKLRNRLGTPKAAKLVFLFKSLNDASSTPALNDNF